MDDSLRVTSSPAGTRTWNKAGMKLEGLGRNDQDIQEKDQQTSAQHPHPHPLEPSAPEEQAGSMTWLSIAELESDARFRTCIKFRFK